MNCRCSLHVPSWRVQWWPVTTLSCENWSQLSIVIIWSPADQSVPALHSAFCCTTRLLGFLQTDRHPHHWRFSQQNIPRSGSLFIMAVLVNVLAKKRVHVVLKQTRHCTGHCTGSEYYGDAKTIQHPAAAKGPGFMTWKTFCSLSSHFLPSSTFIYRSYDHGTDKTIWRTGGSFGKLECIATSAVFNSFNLQTLVLQKDPSEGL